MQRAVGFRETFDGRYRLAHRRGERQAGQHPPAADQHGAGAALTMIAALLRPREIEMLAQRVEQRGARIDVQMIGAVVDGQVHRPCLAARILRLRGNFCLRRGEGQGGTYCRGAENPPPRHATGFGRGRLRKRNHVALPANPPTQNSWAHCLAPRHVTSLRQ